MIPGVPLITRWQPHAQRFGVDLPIDRDGAEWDHIGPQPACGGIRVVAGSRPLRDAREGAGSSHAAPATAGHAVVPAVVPAKLRVPSSLALPRERLEARLGDAFGRRLTLVVAPAGSGKTTLIARFVVNSGAPVAWYRAESWDADEISFVRHLEATLLGVVPDLAGGWLAVEDAVRSLEAASATSDPSAMPRPVLLVVDDLHSLEDTPAEAAFGRLVDYAPSWLTIVAGTRVAPRLNLSRLRVSGDLLEVGTDDLRFRAWEVEQLFREIYQDPVPPADLAVLARRTEGWAAGLQLFHLATRGRSAEERRRVLGGPGSSGRLLREYLAQNVMMELPSNLRTFLLETCVLGRLSGPLCDRLRGATGSGALLDELARRGVFTVPVEDGSDAYRYHEVLRQHLDRMLVEDVGEARARERHAAAGRLLEGAGALPEALRAYSRAEDWEAVHRLLGGQGERLAATGGGRWIEELPPALERHDPWVALAAARRARSDGRWTAALAAYAHAEAGLGPARAAEAPRAERLALVAWLDPGAVAPPDVAGILRSGLVRNPMSASRELGRLEDPAVPAARGLLALAAGDVSLGRRLLQRAAEDGESGPMAVAAARLGIAVARVLAGEQWDARSFDHAVEAAERGGLAWLARLGRELARRLGPPRGRTSLDTQTAFVPGDAATGDQGPDGQWNAALLALASAWSAASGPEPARADAEAAALGFRRVGAGVLEAWARGLEALAAANAGAQDAREVALGAESLGRATGSAVARMLAHVALGLVEGDRGADHEVLASTIAAETGLVPPPWARRPSDGAHGEQVEVGSDTGNGTGTGAADGTGAGEATSPGDRIAVRVRLLGGCTVEVDGRRVAMERAKPRVRSLFRLLAVHAGAAVHREVIQEALWPEADAPAGARSLHVALSALRHQLDEVASRPGGGLVVREGDAYRLDLTPDDVDVGRFEHAVASGRLARARGEPATDAFARALDLYSGDLLPEEGPAEWVTERRDHYRARALEAAQGLAEEALLAGDLTTVIRACRFGLEVDRYQDALWRMLIAARERGGETGAAFRDRHEYALILESLGVSGGSASVALHR